MPVSKTAIAKILSDSIFDPRARGPMKAIADMEDADFFRKQAISMLTAVEWSSKPDDEIRMAISLLALARYFGARDKEASSPHFPTNPDTRP